MFGSFQFGVADFDTPAVYAGAAALTPPHPSAAASGSLATGSYIASAAVSAAHSATGSGTAPTPIYVGASAATSSHASSGSGTALIPVYSGTSALAAPHLSTGAGGAPIPVYTGDSAVSATHEASGNSVSYVGAASGSATHATSGSAILLPPPRVGTSSLSHHSVAVGAGTLKVVEVRFKDTRLVNFLHVDDVGAIIEATLDSPQGDPLDLSTASSLHFVFQKPDGTMLTVAGSPKTDGTDGVAQYAFAAGDLDQAGTWRYQLAATVGTASFKSDVGKLRVVANLPL